MSAPPARHRFTIDDYHRMGETGILTERDRVELIRGEIVRMSPIGPRHAECVDRLTESLVCATTGSARIRVQNPIQIPEDSEPEPDITVARLREGGYRSRHPRPNDVLLVVEVANASFLYDRREKIPLYAEAGIPEVWLVDLTGNIVTVHRDPTAANYADVRVARPGDTLTPLRLPDVQIAITDFVG